MEQKGAEAERGPGPVMLHGRALLVVLEVMLGSRTVSQALNHQ